MVICQGEVWWVDIPPPFGSEAGYRRPVVVAGVWNFSEAINKFLKDMIPKAVAQGIIREEHLPQIIRKYRNLIHPAREVAEGIVVTGDDATLAAAAVEIILRDVRAWHQNKR